jgi:hypothetical protein
MQEQWKNQQVYHVSSVVCRYVHKLNEHEPSLPLISMCNHMRIVHVLEYT